MTTATVRDSETGAALASVRLPLLFPAGLREITPAADDRTFVITDGNRLLLLRVAADGRSAHVRRLSVNLPVLASVELSPDGRTLRMESQTCTEVSCLYKLDPACLAGDGCHQDLEHALPGKQNMWISWDGNGHVLFSWLSARTAPPASQRSGYRVPNVTGPGTDLLAAPMLPVPLPPWSTAITTSSQPSLSRTGVRSSPRPGRSGHRAAYSP